MVLLKNIVGKVDVKNFSALFPALIHVWIASAGMLEWFISTSGEGNSYLPTLELLQENHSLIF